jgi:hypothetical protein
VSALILSLFALELPSRAELAVHARERAAADEARRLAGRPVADHSAESAGSDLAAFDPVAFMNRHS